MNTLKLSPLSSIVLARNNDILYLFTPNDLKNAFGEVDQKLLAEVLKYKVPHHTTLITSLYGDYTISVTMDNYLTSPIKVRHGVLQGDSLSTLLFNLICEHFNHHHKSRKAQMYGLRLRWRCPTETLDAIR